MGKKSDGGVATVKITGMVPVFGINSYEAALAHYVDWLGFNIDWEWREAPGRPVIMSISRGEVSLMLNEGDDQSMGSWLTLNVTDLQALADEWNERKPGVAIVVISPPYDIPSIFLTDPFGNRMDFQQPLSDEETATRKNLTAQMRDYIRERIDNGNTCPTPQEVVDAIGRPKGMAMDVLCEFPEYEQQTRETE